MSDTVANYTNKIRTAIYGRDVRSSIADAIDAMDDAVERLDSSIENVYTYHNVLETNTNLNNITDPGTYYLSSNSSYSYTNVPDKAVNDVSRLNAVSTLIVFPNRSDTYGGCVQMLVQQNTSEYAYVFTRIYTPNGGWSPWADNLPDGTFAFSGVVANGTDLNEVTNQGVYYLTSSSTYPNAPEKLLNSATILIVFPPRVVTNGNYCVQMIVQNANTHAYVFTRIGTTTGWSPWADNIETKYDYFSGIESGFRWEQGTFNATNWAISNSTKYIRTNSDIDTHAIDRVEFNLPSEYRVYFMRHYSDSSRSSDSVYYNGGVSGFCDVSETDKIRIVIRNIDNTIDVPTSAGSLLSCKLITPVYKKAKDFVPRNLMASFKRFSVMSDSLGAGRVYSTPPSTEGGEYSGGMDDKSISWPTFLARSLNNTVYNHSYHGMSADTFILGAIDGSSTGDNSLSCALDGNHDVPLIIIQFGANNKQSLETGSESDIDVNNCQNNGNTIIGNMAKLVQLISNYYATANKPVHIAILLYATTPTGQTGNTPGNPIQQHQNWMTVINKLKTKVRSQGNYLWPIDIFADDSWDMTGNLLQENSVNKHWTSIGYNALGELVGLKVSEYMWNHQEDFNRIEFSGTNTYITSYSNPSNYT